MVTTSNKPPRTQEEIVEKLERVKQDDFFGFKTTDLLGYLDYEHAKPYLKEGCTKEEWGLKLNDRESILAEMKDYMPFAWDKANNQRGISAGRSMAHYNVWVWMLRDEEVFGDLEEYQYYGKDNLRKLCDTYGWDANQWDDNIREN